MDGIVKKLALGPACEVTMSPLAPTSDDIPPCKVHLHVVINAQLQIEFLYLDMRLLFDIVCSKRASPAIHYMPLQLSLP